jgi:hypothetical protein
MMYCPAALLLGEGGQISDECRISDQKLTHGVGGIQIK